MWRRILLACENYPVISAEYSTDFDFQDEQQLEKECRKYEEMTLRATNRLIEWYRYHTRRYNVRKMVLSQIDPIFIRNHH